MTRTTAGAPLDGMFVVDLTTGISGGYCGKLLADAGAEVVKAEPPGGDPLRRWSATGAPLGGRDGALFEFLNASKKSIEIGDTDTETLRGLLAHADAVLWSPTARRLGRVDPEAIHREHPFAVVAAMTPFGLSGRWAERPATEFTMQGLGGGMGTRGRPTEPPVSNGGNPGEWLTGMFAAVGVLAARWRRHRTGRGELVDVSMLESTILVQEMYPFTYVSMAGRPWRDTRSVNLPNISPTKDGYVGFMVVTAQMWEGFCLLVERPEWLDDQSLYLYKHRMARRAELEEAIRAWTSVRTTDEVVERAIELRVPVAPVGRGDTVPTFDHFRARGFFVDSPSGGFVHPDVPYTLSAGSGRVPFAPSPRRDQDRRELVARASEVPAPRPTGTSEAADDLPFSGLRVADFTAFWAGPIVGHVLAMYGAEVIHVESVTRPDGIRGNTVKTVEDDEWWEWAPPFHGPNTNKLGITLDLNDEGGRALARRLIASSDIVLENYAPRVFDEWGLSYEEVRALNASAVMVRMPAFGLSGPWRDRTGYAQTMEQVSGMAWITGFPDGEPVIPNGACDPIAGTHATFALLLALEHRRRTGEGMQVEVAMVGAALNIAAEQVVEYSAYGRLLERSGNRGPGASLRDTFRTADVTDDGTRDTWICVEAATAEQWKAVAALAALPPWAIDDAFLDQLGRDIRADDAIELLARWIDRQNADEVVDQLLSAGVPASKVLMPYDRAALPQLEDRRFFEEVRHPVTGLNVHGGYPARLTSGPARLHRNPAPTLGQHNHAVLGGLLGLDADELSELERAGRIGNAPVGRHRVR